MEHTTTFKWKTLSSDGLLKEPKNIGPYYSETSINQYDGFNTRDEAIDYLNKLAESDPWALNDSFVLIEEHYFRLSQMVV
jgi:hypothetical protein